MTAPLFTANDRIRHAGKPEWGVGVVLSAQNTTHDGDACQRLVIRFDQAGRKTISTAFADIRPLDRGEQDPPKPENPVVIRQRAAPPRPTHATPKADQSASPDEVRARLTALPAEISDRFRPLEDRLRDTLDLYRYDPAGRGLLDWASSQTGLRDSMSVFNRHELEQHFQTYRVGLDRHLKSLLDESRRARLDPAPFLASAPHAAQHALRRINHSR